MSAQPIDDFRPMPGALSPRLTTAEAAVVSRRHPVTVRRALEDEALHGQQSKAGGRWLIRAECLDAWIDGVKCEHKANVVPLRRPVGASAGRAPRGK
jgi:Helix-turn-helix domain